MNNLAILFITVFLTAVLSQNVSTPDTPTLPVTFQFNPGLDVSGLNTLASNAVSLLSLIKGSLGLQVIAVVGLVFYCVRKARKFKVGNVEVDVGEAAVAANTTTTAKVETK